MNSYLLESAQWGLIERNPQVLCSQFARFIGKDVRFLSPVLFAEYSCLTQFVYEEIDLVVSHQVRATKARLSIDEFITFWGWEPRLEQKVYALSGGWRKLLLLHLFLNQMNQNVMLVDFCTHLSDASIDAVLGGIEQLQYHAVAFLEYDPALLRPHLTQSLALYHADDRFIAEKNGHHDAALNRSS